MYKPKTPCTKDCKDRDVAFCIKCEKLKQYKAQMNEYYEAEHREKSVVRAYGDLLDTRAREKHKKKGYRNFIKR